MTRAKDPEISAEYLRRLLEYCPDMGTLKWRVRRSQRVHAGATAGGRPVTLRGKQYFRLRVLGRLIFAHRVIWKMQTGEWPAGEVDHIDGDGTNNRWANLRLADRSLNCANLVRLKSNNKSGRVGVCFNTRHNLWVAHLRRGKKRVLHSYHQTFEAAVEARRIAEARIADHYTK